MRSSDRFQTRAREWQSRWPTIGDVRGLGGMQAIELVKSQEDKTPATEETKKITQYCYEHGLITITAGTYSNVIRVLVPLVATDAQIDEGLTVLEVGAGCGVWAEGRSSPIGVSVWDPSTAVALLAWSAKINRRLRMTNLRSLYH